MFGASIAPQPYGVPASPAYVPMMGSHLTPRMTLPQRAFNLITYFANKAVQKYVFYAKYDELALKLGITTKSCSELMPKVRLRLYSFTVLHEKHLNPPISPISHPSPWSGEDGAGYFLPCVGVCAPPTPPCEAGGVGARWPLQAPPRRAGDVDEVRRGEEGGELSLI